MTTPNEPHTQQYSHINGPVEELLDRLAVSELCKGWPVYRDASEWMNFRSLFCEEAHVWTTWSGVQTIDSFIAMSRKGKANGAFIQHRECGTLVELNPATGRAVGKMKATITQRFRGPISVPAARSSAGNEGENGVSNGVNGHGGTNGTAHGEAVEEIEYDVDCDCRFLFFCTKQQQQPPTPQPLTNGGDAPADAVPEGGRPTWKVRYVKLVYEKDKVVPLRRDGWPEFSAEEMVGLPEGYKFLGAAQRRLGYDIDAELVTVRDLGSWEKMYSAVEGWLGGDDADLF
ncbi:unnamed protein product [Parascedosporium putredinis]|uniref:SnoaL-like domain-containing protein n=1 Tax=Parascedosporium putredinis TaxID=1442378 RepID=A0A9P1HAL9_9PEZI|nr:unnamed protein product [Parascedosporium putredinis]CAI8002866.1 unnamed protein product [Parascedosporium putredinis]